MRKIIVVLSVVLAAGVLAAVACAREDAPAVQSQAAATTAPDPVQGTAGELAPDEIGHEATCPVTGETFTVAAGTEAVVYQGHLYLFCCPGCRGRFLGNPQQFGAPAPAGS
ncbi:MAG: YHS domain-containing protein [Deltaproteobacteria bacterium]|nr:YHS domain-containing protein [Deltaproteobacteria bacterium]